MNKDEEVLQKMKEDAKEIMNKFNEALRAFTKKYPGFALHICDSLNCSDGSKLYDAEINGKV